jgi:predicted flap endonuclease-1-like 5' DNA nuclease
MNQVHERAITTWDHVRFALGRGQPQPELPADEPEADDGGGSGLALFVWGALTALVLWWLYLQPRSAERRSQPAARPRTPPAGRRPSPPPTRAAPQRERTEGPAARETAEDDLTLVYGIGPARAARLREAGIATFAALAVADAEQLRDILSGVGVGVANADVSSWPEQAALAARGDWDGLETYQEQLREERG